MTILTQELLDFLKAYNNQFSKDTSKIVSKTLENSSEKNCKNLLEQLTKESNREKGLESYALASIFERGNFEGVSVFKKSDKEIVELYENAAEKNQADAQYRLGFANEHGQFGLERNRAKALKLYQRAANNNNDVAQYHLGVANEEGELGLKENVTEALELYNRAAANGNANAQYRLATAYEKGELGLEINNAKALELYSKSPEIKVNRLPEESSRKCRESITKLSETQQDQSQDQKTWSERNPKRHSDKEDESSRKRQRSYSI